MILINDLLNEYFNLLEAKVQVFSRMKLIGQSHSTIRNAIQQFTHYEHGPLTKYNHKSWSWTPDDQRHATLHNKAEEIDHSSEYPDFKQHVTSGDRPAIHDVPITGVESRPSQHKLGNTLVLKFDESHPFFHSAKETYGKMSSESLKRYPRDNSYKQPYHFDPHVLIARTGSELVHKDDLDKMSEMVKGKKLSMLFAGNTDLRDSKQLSDRGVSDPTTQPSKPKIPGGRPMTHIGRRH